MNKTLQTVTTALVELRYYRLIGRFHGLRRVAATLQRLGDRVRGRPRPARGAARDPVDAWLAEIRQHSHCPAPPLTPSDVTAIRRFAEVEPCRQANGSERFRISELRDGRSPGGEVIAVADVVAPTGCPEIARIAEDPALLAVATRFLGYHPRRTRTRLYWSPVSPASDDERRAAGQAIDFHYDIDACNSLYLYYYLLGGDADSGAHALVERSHGPKPARIIAGSCFQSDRTVFDLYGADSVAVVTGPPGFGFFEDPACFHKALAPTRAPRLCLQLRYS